METNLSKLEKKIYPILRQKQMEVSYLPPQNLGPFTQYYHRIIPAFKTAPWRVILLGGVFATFLLRLLLGAGFVRLASLLQGGF